MALTAADLDTIREWVGSTDPDTDTISAMFDSHGTALATARAILRTREADLLADPLQFSVAGDYSQNADSQLAALQARIARLDALIGDDSAGTAIQVGQMYRPDPARQFPYGLQGDRGWPHPFDDPYFPNRS